MYTTFGASEKSEVQYDSVVASVIRKFKVRADFGQKKYGTTLDRNDLSIVEWINHAQEEHMDAILYLEKLKQEFSSSSKSTGASAEEKTTGAFEKKTTEKTTEKNVQDFEQVAVVETQEEQEGSALVSLPC